MHFSPNQVSVPSAWGFSSEFRVYFPSTLRHCLESKSPLRDFYLQLFLVCFTVDVLGLFNEETVVAALFQLHNNVQETTRTASGAFEKCFVIPSKDPSGNIKKQGKLLRTGASLLIQR